MTFSFCRQETGFWARHVWVCLPFLLMISLVVCSYWLSLLFKIRQLMIWGLKKIAVWDLKKRCDLLVSVCGVAIPECSSQVTILLHWHNFLWLIFMMLPSRSKIGGKLTAAATQTICCTWSIASHQNESGTTAWSETKVVFAWLMCPAQHPQSA